MPKHGEVVGGAIGAHRAADVVYDSPWYSLNEHYVVKDRDTGKTISRHDRRDDAEKAAEKYVGNDCQR
jgi:hypothetical protein